MSSVCNGKEVGEYASYLHTKTYITKEQECGELLIRTYIFDHEILTAKEVHKIRQKIQTRKH